MDTNFIYFQHANVSIFKLIIELLVVIFLLNLFFSRIFNVRGIIYV